MNGFDIHVIYFSPSLSASQSLSLSLSRLDVCAYAVVVYCHVGFVFLVRLSRTFAFYKRAYNKSLHEPPSPSVRRRRRNLFFLVNDPNETAHFIRSVYGLIQMCWPIV